VTGDVDLSATEGCHCLAARRYARAITRLYEQRLRPHGLRATQLSILAALALKGPTPIGELADFLVLERTTLSRSAALLQRRGWVEIALEGPNHELDWPVIDEELHTFVNDEEHRNLDTYLYGRRMYEAMAAYWPTVRDDSPVPRYVKLMLDLSDLDAAPKSRRAERYRARSASVSIRPLPARRLCRGMGWPGPDRADAGPRLRGGKEKPPCG